jgi:hypothetical protein
MMWLSHILFRSGGIPDPDRPASLDGDAGTGGVAREGVGEAGGVVDFLTIWRVSGH